MNSIAQEIVVRRAFLGITQKELAERLNVSQRTIASWESGKSFPRNTMKVQLAKVFGLRDDYFLKYSSPDDEPLESSPENIILTSEEIESKLNNCLKDEKLGISQESYEKCVKAFMGALDNYRKDENIEK